MRKSCAKHLGTIVQHLVLNGYDNNSFKGKFVFVPPSMCEGAVKYFKASPWSYNWKLPGMASVLSLKLCKSGGSILSGHACMHVFGAYKPVNGNCGGPWPILCIAYNMQNVVCSSPLYICPIHVSEPDRHLKTMTCWQFSCSCSTTTALLNPRHNRFSIWVSTILMLFGIRTSILILWYFWHRLRLNNPIGF